jgi:glycosyltransferase involved in cell wall biosynthesis
MKIAVINNLYQPYQRGGAERIAELLAAGLSAQDHQVFVIATKPKIPVASLALQEKATVHYLPSYYYNLKDFPIWRRALWQAGNIVNIQQARALKKVLESDKPDLVITNNLMGFGWLVPLMIKRLKLKHLHILHDIQLLHPSGLMYYGQEKMLDRWPAKIYQALTAFLWNRGGTDMTIVSPSHWLLELHHNRGFFKSNRSAVLANPAPELKITAPTANPAANQIKDETVRFIFIGQLEKHKGLDLFLAAARHFQGTNIDWKIIGDGTLKAIAKAEAAKNPQLDFLGWIPTDRVIAELQASSALIIPSRCYENAPNVIAEAAVAGTVSLAAAIGGIPEMIERYGGLTFEPDNLEALIEAINLFLKNKTGFPVKIPAPADYSRDILKLITS